MMSTMLMCLGMIYMLTACPIGDTVWPITHVDCRPLCGPISIAPQNSNMQGVSMDFSTAEVIRGEYADRHLHRTTQRELAAKYNCSQSTVSSIVNGDAWRGVRKAQSSQLQEQMLTAGMLRIVVWVESGDVERVMAYDQTRRFVTSGR